MRKKIVIIFILLVIGAGFYFVKGQRETGVEDFKELKIGTGWDSTRPGNYTPWGMWEPAVIIYESLVNLDEDCHPIPCLAKEWVISADGLTYTFTLNSGVKFHDGNLLNAGAVKENYDKLKNANWLALNHYIKEVKVLDEYTVRFCLKMPYPLMLKKLAGSLHGIVSPAAIVEKKDARGAAKNKYIIVRPAGTGPYKWDRDAYKRNRSFSVIRNDEYWRGMPHFQRITWEVIPDAGARTIALESGRIQMTGQSPNASLTPENVISLKKNDRIKIVKANNWGTRLLIVNHKRPPFDNIKVRRALKYAIDYNGIQKILGELATICPGPFAPDTPFTHPVIKLYEYNPERANAILDKEGLIDTDGNGFREYKGKDIRIEIISAKSILLSVLMQEYFKKIGIGLRISPRESGSLFQILEQNDFDIASHPNIPSFSLSLYQQFSDKGRWSLRLNDLTIEQLLSEYAVCTDYDKFKRLNYRIQEEVHKKEIILFAVNESKLAAYHKELGDFIFPPEEWVGAVQEIWRMK